MVRRQATATLSASTALIGSAVESNSGSEATVGAETVQATGESGNAAGTTTETNATNGTVTETRPGSEPTLAADAVVGPNDDGGAAGTTTATNATTPARNSSS